MEGHFVRRIAAIRKVYARQRNYTLLLFAITYKKKLLLFYCPFIRTAKEILPCPTVKLQCRCSTRKINDGSGQDRPQARRLSRKTACSPNRFQNHHGALSRSGEPQAFSATAFSILTPISVQSWRKSLMVQWWILGVSYQLNGSISVRGIWPANSSWSRTCQWPKFGNDTIA